jgi:hypothetical protein
MFQPLAINLSGSIAQCLMSSSADHPRILGSKLNSIKSAALLAGTGVGPEPP